MPGQFLEFLYLGQVLTPRFIIYGLVLFTGVLTGLISYRHASHFMKMLILLLTVTFISEVLTRIIAWRFGMSNPIYHLFAPVQMVFYTLLYYRLFQEWKKMQALVVGAGVVCTLLSVGNSFLLQSLSEFPSNSTALLSLLVVCFSLMSFFNMLTSPDEGSLTHNAVFWLNLGNIIFYPVTFFVFGLFAPLIKIFRILPEWQYILIWLMNLVLYSSYTLSILLDARKNKSDI